MLVRVVGEHPFLNFLDYLLFLFQLQIAFMLVFFLDSASGNEGLESSRSRDNDSAINLVLLACQCLVQRFAICQSKEGLFKIWDAVRRIVACGW